MLSCLSKVAAYSFPRSDSSPFRVKKNFLSFKFQHTNFNRLYFLSGKGVYLQFMRNIREPSGQGFLVNMTPLLLSEEKQ